MGKFNKRNGWHLHIYLNLSYNHSAMQLDPHNQLIMKFTWVCIMILSPSNNISQGIRTISPFCYMARWRCMIFSEKIKLCSKLPEPSYHEFAQHHKMMHIRIIQSESNGNIQEGKKLDVLRRKSIVHIHS